MKSEKAKVLHEVCGRPMIRYVVDAVRGAGAKTIVVVVGHGRANPQAVAQAVRVAARAAEGGLVPALADRLARSPVDVAP